VLVPVDSVTSLLPVESTAVFVVSTEDVVAVAAVCAISGSGRLSSDFVQDANSENITMYAPSL